MALTGLLQRMLLPLIVELEAASHINGLNKMILRQAAHVRADAATCSLSQWGSLR